LKTILLIQENPASLLAFAMVLRSQGWTVLETEDQTQAIHACLENNRAIKLLLTDFELRSDHGPEVAKRLLELSPEMRVIFVLNSAPERLLDTGSLPGGYVFLSKPFDADTLINALEILSKPSRAPRVIQGKPK